MPYVHFSRKTGSAGQKEGIAILSRRPFEKVETIDLKSQHRVAQWVQVEVEGQPLVVANGHFFWQPGPSPKREDQVKLLGEHLSAIPGNPAVVVCGDFNSIPESESIQCMEMVYRSAYKTVHGREPSKTAPTGLPVSKLAMLGTLITFLKDIRWRHIRLDWMGTLDYIFYNDRLKVIDSRLVLDQPAPQQANLYPSDHFGILAEFEIIPPGAREVSQEERVF